MVHLRLLGALDLRGSDGHEIRSVLVQPKRFALLVYLALAAPRGFHRRDKLLALFWPDLDNSRARNALSQALHTLRRGMGEGVLVNRGDEEVGLMETEFECDVMAFDRACAESRWAEALELYRGELLQGFFATGVAPDFEEWLHTERERLRSLAVCAALSQASDVEGQGNLHLALHWVQAAGRMVPYEEAVLERRLDLLERQGDRTGALVAYHGFERRLREELGVEPSARLRRRVGEIRAAERGRSDAGAALVAAPIDDGRPIAMESEPMLVSRALARPVRRRKARWALVAGAATTFALVGVAVPTMMNRSPGVATPETEFRPPGSVAARAPADRSIAVLPFEDMSPGKDQGYFSDGITEEIVTTLDQVERLLVISRASVMQYKGTDKPARQIASELGVGRLLTGSVQRVGDRVRIRTQLIDAGSEAQLWAQGYDRPVTDVLAVQSEIALEIARSLQRELTPEEEGRMARRPTGDFSAYDLLLRGREYYYRHQAQDNEVAIRFFRRALELDPEYVDALVMLTHAYMWKGQPFGGGQAWEDSAIAVARRAIRVDSTSARAHDALGWALNFAERDEEALPAYLRAQELNPDLTAGLADLYSNGYGRLDEAVRLLQRELTINPTDPVPLDLLGRNYAMLGMLDEAEPYFERAIVIQPVYQWAYAWLGHIAILRGRASETPGRIHRMIEAAGPDAMRRAGQWAGQAGDLALARAYFQRVYAPGDTTPLRVLQSALTAVWVYQQSGETERARHLMRRMAAGQEWEYPHRKFGTLANLARYRVLEGNRDEALRLMTTAVRRGWRDYYLLPTDPILRSLRGDPRFDRLMSEAKVRIDLQRARVEREAW